ncbi:MAG: helix-turn-helix domain-containing protein [Firmicutes bacterium]|nr:helix-turn-helix domain-containing protein [Bacillota bacterium]
MTIGERIQKLRKASNLTQGQLGNKLGVSDKTVSKWETEGGIPDVGILDSIGEFFGISLDFLMKGKEKEGDQKAVALIAGYEEQEQKKSTNLGVILSCKRLLAENGIEIKDEYLPQTGADKTIFRSFGVFDMADTTRFSLPALLKNGLTKAAVKHFGEVIKYTDAILCDDTSVYAKAQENYTKAKENHEAENKRQKLIWRNHRAEPFVVEDINWTLENLDSALSHYYEVIIWLIDNGAAYYKSVCDTSMYYAVAENFMDSSKTQFFYRVAKDMIKCGNCR